MLLLRKRQTLGLVPALDTALFPQAQETLASPNSSGLLVVLSRLWVHVLTRGCPKETIPSSGVLYIYSGALLSR